jgi:hypothetical protein
MGFMAVVISLEAWRSGRREPVDTGRLERAVRRLDVLARPQADRDRLAPDIECDLLTIVGELAMGWLDQAAERAERLCDRLVAEGG